MIKRWLSILLLSSTVLAEPFDSMIALTRQDPSMDWWYAVPGEFVPQLSRIGSVTRDEYFRIIPIFSNYGVDSNRAANITFGIEVIRPDGSVDLSMPKCEGHKGTADAPNLLPAQAILNLCFEPEDPFGTYTVNLTAVDHVRSQTNRQSEVIELREFEWEELDSNERGALFYNYATSPAPSKALAAFLQTKHSFFNEESEPIWSAIWFFKTIFDDNEYLLPLMVDQYTSGSQKQKRDIILVLALMNQTELLPRLSGELKQYKRALEAGHIPDPYDEVTTGKQLDMLWGEFFATGTVEPIRQIVRSLRLVEHVGTLDKIKADELDPETLDVYRAGTLEAVFQSALWSLKSNCKTAPLAYHYCVGILHSNDLKKPEKNCLAMLLQSIAAEQETDQPTEEIK